MRILIIKLGAIGDVLRTTSVLKGLSQKYPGAVIDWLTAENAKDVLLYNPFIKRLFVWEEIIPNIVPDVVQTFRSAISEGRSKDLRYGSYDLVIGLEDDFAACEVATKLNGGKILGAYIKDGKINYTPSAWFDMSVISKFGLEKANELKKQNTKTFQQHMADLLGIEAGEYVFQLTPEEVEWGRRYLKTGEGPGRPMKWGEGRRVIGINTGAGKRWQLKALSVDKTIELINRIKTELGWECLILGGGDERERNTVIARETGMPDAGVHSLRQFASIINACDALITSDSLALHFGIALKKKLVVFFGPTSSVEIELYGLGVKVMPKMDCLSCYCKTCDKKPNCMEGINIDEILRGLPQF